MSQRWYTGSGDGPAQAREAMEGIVDVFAEHGPVLRALADAAADDPEVERVYGASCSRSSTSRASTSRPRSRRAGWSRSTPARPRGRSCG
jgi:hypothetical protein